MGEDLKENLLNRWRKIYKVVGVGEGLGERAFERAVEFYDGKNRLSGEGVLEFAIYVAERVVEFNPDEGMLLATLFLQVFESEKYDAEDFRSEFGVDIADLVEILAKLNGLVTRRSDSSLEVLRNVVLTVAKDVRALVIRLVERAVNMETLHLVKAENRREIAKETLQIYVPFAMRLSMYSLKQKLEDLSFRWIWPEEFEKLSFELREMASQFDKNINETIVELKDFLKVYGIDVKVIGRMKNLFSIYNKLKKKNFSSLSDLYDVYAMRIIIPTTKDKDFDIECLYRILSLLHKKYTPIPDRFKDYVMNPKENGYQSLHTAVSGIISSRLDFPTEIQIRTEEMDLYADSGDAAHWMYKIGGKIEDVLIGKDEKNGQAKFDWENYSLDNKNLKRIFVLTPKGAVKELVQDATPVDFAYAIHSDIGHKCVLAKVNGQVVSLDSVLKSGDVVEITCGSEVRPKLNWLGFVKTSLAKNRIKNFFRAKDREKLFDEGKEILNEILVKHGFHELDEGLTLFKVYQGKKMSLRERESLVEEVGAGVLSGNLVLRYALGEEFEVALRESVEKKVEKQKSMRFEEVIPKSVDSKLSENLIIGGQKNMPYRVAECCKPKLNENLIGYVTKTKGISVHRGSCSFLRKADSNRVLSVVNSKFAGKKDYVVQVSFSADEREGHLSDIMMVMNNNFALVMEFLCLGKEGGKLKYQFVLKVQSREQVDKLMKDLESVQKVALAVSKES